MQFHQIADLFPLMEGEQFKNFIADIKENGLMNPIYVYEGQILDGRNRYNACLKLGIEPRCVEYTGDDPISFIFSSNLHRRHLNAYQRAKIALIIMEQLESEIKIGESEKKREAAIAQWKKKRAKGKRYYGDGILRNEENHRDKWKEAGKLSNVSMDTITKVKVIEKKATEQQKERLKKGKSSVNAVYREIKRIDKKEEIEKIPPQELKGKYNVFLADPPWQYEQTPTFMRGMVDDHYPTMDVEAIKKLPIKDMSLDNAVLFLWTTAVMIRKAFAVMEAWGFEFKTSMVWVKSHIGTGFYVRSKHEIILIGVKGSFLPMTTDIPESVFFADKGKHSEKPEILYEIIEKMYPGQKKIELFARKARTGWMSWGNEL